MTWSISFRELADYDAICNSLSHGHQSSVREELAALANSPREDAISPTYDWLAARLKVPWPDTRAKKWPSAMINQWKGWLSYYNGLYLQASEHFCTAWEDNPNTEYPDFSRDIALGLGKVYTRSGHWNLARKWLLYFLSEARKAQEITSVMQGYGALGELLLRANHPREALACLNITYHLLPPGSGQQARQLNYLASALARNGEWLRAESLLRTSLQIARDTLGRRHGLSDASGSIHHALTRLQFLELMHHGANARDLTRQPAIPPQEYERLQPAPVAQGLLSAALALRHIMRNEHDLAKTQLTQAHRMLSQQFPMESLWVNRMMRQLGAQPLNDAALVSGIFRIPTLQAPVVTNTLDKTWLHPTIPDENGFRTLFESSIDLHELSRQWTLFFV